MIALDILIRNVVKFAYLEHCFSEKIILVGDLCECAQSGLTLRDYVPYPPVSSIPRIFQARILEWVAISYYRGLPQPGIKPKTSVSSGLGFTVQILYLCVNSLGIGEGNGTPLQYSCLENPMDKEPGRLQSMGWLRVGQD